MKTETLLLLAVAGVAAYYFWKQSQGGTTSTGSFATALANPIVRQYDTIAAIYQRIQNAVGGSGSIALLPDQWSAYIAQFSSAPAPGSLGLDPSTRVHLNDYWVKATPALQAMGLSGFGGGWPS